MPIERAEDLVTTHEAVRQGLLEQALVKTTKAVPFIDEARALAAALHAVDGIDQLATAHVAALRTQLVAAAGFSDKAKSHLSEKELDGALGAVLTSIRDSAGEAWRDEIVFRFLLTRGDTLGGSIRNYTGAVGGVKLSAALVQALTQSGIEAEVRKSTANPEKTTAINWGGRAVYFDRKPPLVSMNIDVILVDTTVGLSTPLACGELKGGIDPAGADEHWKTARSAFERIRQSFQMSPPLLFFVGAAIEQAMAVEIFDDLSHHRLAAAANLTSDSQMLELSQWLVSL